MNPPIQPPNYSAPLIHMASQQGSGPNAKIPRLPNGQIDNMALIKFMGQPPGKPLFQNGSWGQPANGLQK
jgi:hypothetical protein